MTVVDRAAASLSDITVTVTRPGAAASFVLPMETGTVADAGANLDK